MFINVSFLIKKVFYRRNRFLSNLNATIMDDVHVGSTASRSRTRVCQL